MNNPFINEHLYLKEIPEIGGWGVYTNAPLQQGEIIEVSPVILYPQKLLNIGIYMSIAEGVKPKDIMLDQYGIYWNGTDKLAIMLGYMSMYNHSNNPNSSIFVHSERLIGLSTLRPIDANEQLTISYGPDWFEKKKDYLTCKEF